MPTDRCAYRNYLLNVTKTEEELFNVWFQIEVLLKGFIFLGMYSLLTENFGVLINGTDI